MFYYSHDEEIVLPVILLGPPVGGGDGGGGMEKVVQILSQLDSRVLQKSTLLTLSKNELESKLSLVAVHPKDQKTGSSSSFNLKNQDKHISKHRRRENILIFPPKTIYYS